MEKPIRNVLVVGVPPEFHGRFEPLLRRKNFDVDRVSESASAVDLIEAVAFDVLVVGYPLTDPCVSELLEVIRRKDSPCRRSAVLILAPPGDFDDAAEIIDNGFTRLISLEASDDFLHRTISSLLRVAPRLSVRITIRLEVGLGDGPTMMLTQTENVSAGGFLARLPRVPGLEENLRFELLLADGVPPVKGTGEVVRHVKDPRGRVSAAGIRFVTFDGDGQERLWTFLNEKAAI